MKESGVEWLGRVPAHWEMRKLRHILRSVSKRYRPELPLLSVVRERGVIIRDISSKDENHNVVPDDLTNYKVVEQFQFAMNKMKAWQGSYGVSDYLGIVSPAYFVFNIQGVGSSYFHRAIRSKAYVPYFTQASDGVRIGQWDLSTSAMREIPFLIPPPTEQAVIVRFLDHADRRIRRYIRAKEKLIALLEEQKQAIIYQAVTGRIDVRTGQPYPAYKPSGVGWLGDVPAMWKIRRLKTLANIPSGQVDPRSEEHRHKILIAPNHMLPGGGKLTDLETADEQGADSGKYEIRVGDVIYSKIRPNLRKAVISPVAGLCSADMYPIRVNTGEISTSFFLRLLLSDQVTRYAVECSLRVAMPKINREALGDCWLAYPTLQEQRKIVDHIGKETSHLELAVKQARSEIGLLREYRTRLIADVVTGKLDVREAAAALPEVDAFAEDDDADDPLDAVDAPAFDDDREVAEVVG